MENSKYIIVRELSKGGQGTVYRGFDKAVGRPVAIKEFTYKNEGEKHRIEENIKAAKLCFHPALPGILDIYEYPGKICMVMEFTKGMTLH